MKFVPSIAFTRTFISTRKNLIILNLFPKTLFSIRSSNEFQRFYSVQSQTNFNPENDNNFSNSNTSTTSIKKMPLITLYQFELCPFCSKVRAFLDFYKIQYKVVPISPNPLRRRRKDFPLHKLNPSNSKLPIIRFSDPNMNIEPSDNTHIQTKNDFTHVEMQDSSRIISFLYNMRQELMEEGSTSDSKNSKNCESNIKEVIWRSQTDDVYVKLLPLNVYGTLSDAFEMTDNVVKTTPNMSQGDWFVIRILSPVLLRYVHVRKHDKEQKQKSFSKSPQKLLEEASEQWLEAVYGQNDKEVDDKIEKRVFHGGVSPDLADLSVYGVLSSIVGTRTHSNLMKQNKKMENWYNAVRDSIGKSSRI